jgi:hypothetical protein
MIRKAVLLLLLACMVAGISTAAEQITPPWPDVRWAFNAPYDVEVRDRVHGRYPARVLAAHPDDRYYVFHGRAAGIEGHALFLGHRAWVQTSVRLPDRFTLSFWFQPGGSEAVAGAQARQLARWNEKVWVDYRNGKLDMGGLAPVALTPGRWHHIAVTQDNARAVLFVEGREAGETRIEPSAALPLRFFEGTARERHGTAGCLDEVRVYNRVLPDNQIRVLASPAYYRDEKPLVADAGIDHTRWTDGEARVALAGQAIGAEAVRWEAVDRPDGGRIELATPNALDSQVSLSGRGKYVLRLTARNAEGNISQDETTILVLPAQETRKGRLHRRRDQHTFPGGAPVKPLARFKFDEVDGQITRSADGRHAVDIGKTADRHGGARITNDQARGGGSLFYDRNGRKHLTSFGPLLKGSKSGTLSFWIRPVAESSEEQLFSVPDVWAFSVGNAIGWKGLASSGPKCILPKDAWSHLVLSWDTWAARVFLDGQQIYYEPVVTGASSDGNLCFNRSGPSHKKFVGYLDELTVYDFFINPDEARLLHEKGPEAFTKRLPYGKDWTYGYTPEFITKHFPAIEGKLILDGYAKDRISPVDAPYIHPRVYFGPGDLPDLRRRLRYTKAGQSRFNALKTIVQARIGRHLADMKTPLPLFFTWKGAESAAELDDAATERDFSFHNKDLTGPYTLEAFRCLIENDQKTARRLVDMLVRQAEVQQWYMRNVQAARGRNWQNSTHTMIGRRSTAIIYDLLYSWMTETQRALVRRTIADAINDKWSTGLDAVYGVRGHNWACWMTGDIMINAMAIEGEDGFDPELLARCITFYKQFLFTAAGPRDGSPFPGMAKHSITTGKLLAIARRGVRLAAASMPYNHYRQYNLHCFQPFGGYQIVDDLRGSSMGGVHLSDLSVVKYVYPNDPVIDYVYRRATGEAYERHGVSPNVLQYTSPLVGLVAADDWAGPADPAEQLKQAGQNAELSRLFNYNNTFSARTGWDEGAALLWFWPRMMGGHALPARGTFVFSALGREWATYPGYGVQADSRNHSLVLVDDETPGTQWGRVIRHEETGMVSSVTADLICPYSRRQPDFLDKNWFRAEPEPYPWDDLAMGLHPNWLKGNWPEVARPLFDLGAARKQASQWRPDNFRSAYRSATLVRGKHAYALIVDDFEKDEGVHEWTWRLALSPDLGTEVSVNGRPLEPTAKGPARPRAGSATPPGKPVQGDAATARLLESADHDGAQDARLEPLSDTRLAHDIVVADPGTRRRLLVRLFRVTGAPDIRLEGKTVVTVRGGGKRAVGLNRIAITIEGRRADFAVMLYPFIQGTAVPEIGRDGDGWTLSWPDQKDILALTSKPGWATQVRIERRQNATSSSLGTRAGKLARSLRTMGRFMRSSRPAGGFEGGSSNR